MKSKGNGLDFKERTDSVDWEDIRLKVQKSIDRLEHGIKPTPEERNEIFSKRAKAAARIAEANENPEENIEMLVFRFCNELYGIGSSWVREVCFMRDFTPIPCTPAYVVGVINLRGQILSVIDIKILFNLQSGGLNELNRVIVIGSDKVEFGVLADSISGTKAISMYDLRKPVEVSSGFLAGCMKGITRDDIIVLDAGKILSEAGIIVNEEVIV